MKILITGGYGFIGSTVAERFYKEGCEIYILDNLSTGDNKNIDFKHKSYIYSVEDRKCEEIFRNNRFEAVIHLAAQVSVAKSVENPRLDAETNVVGLTNMLALSQKYGVQKFIFASSAAVYGPSGQIPVMESAECSPISPYGIHKWFGESYCHKWQTLYGLETLCLRFSNVYGPRQSSAGEGGVISVFMERTLQGKELLVNGDGEQTRDFIFVEDVADAIFRASYSKLTGVYNLSTRTETSVNEMVDMLRSLHGNISVVYRDPREGDIPRSSLDNKALMNQLDWAPKYSVEEGLAKTYGWFSSRLQQQRRGRKKEAVKRDAPLLLVRFLRAVLPSVENAILFGCIAWVTFLFENAYDRLIDFKLLYIIVMGILYGNRQAILAVALSTGLYTFQVLDDGREVVSLLNDPDYFFQCAVYLFIGLIVGYAVERRAHLLEAKERELEALDEKHAFLNEVYLETRQVKEELQQQIMNNGDSFGKIYSITKELESLEPEKIFTATVSVVESIMKADTVTIHTVNKYRSYLRLVARSNTNFEAPKSMKVEDYSYLRQLLKEKQIYINKELKGDAPLLSAPVINQGEVVAVISIQNVKFEHFTMYYQNLFKIIVDLISSALSRSLYHVEATGSQRYLAGTSILKADVFAEILESKRTARLKHGIEYILLKPGQYAEVSDDLAERIAKSLRETDYIGLDETSRIVVLLSNSSVEDAAFVVKRFKGSGIDLNIVQEELKYA